MRECRHMGSLDLLLTSSTRLSERKQGEKKEGKFGTTIGVAESFTVMVRARSADSKQDIDRTNRTLSLQVIPGSPGSRELIIFNTLLSAINCHDKLVENTIDQSIKSARRAYCQYSRLYHSNHDGSVQSEGKNICYCS